MTTPVWQAPKGEFKLFGVVTYHCAECKEAIPQGEHVFVDEGRVLDEGEQVTKTTQSYHREHLPEVTNGSR